MKDEKIKYLEREGFIKKLAIDEKKVENAFNLAKRDVEFSNQIKSKNFDWAFAIAYNSMLQAARALMFSYGYRPSSENAHVAVIKFIEVALGEEFNKEITTLDRLRRKRHTALYDEVGTISEFEADFAVKTAKKFLEKIRNMLNQSKK